MSCPDDPPDEPPIDITTMGDLIKDGIVFSIIGLIVAKGVNVIDDISNEEFEEID